jgi:hypothetical protein
MSSRTAACRCGTTRSACLPIKAFALILAGLLAATQSYAADEKPPPNRVERAADKAAQGVDKAAKRTGKAVERAADKSGKWAARTAKRTGKAVERAADKTENWIKKQTE